MRFDGVYETDTAARPVSEPINKPIAVRATGSQEEWEKLSAPLPVTPAPAYDKVFDPFTGWTNAKKPNGKHVADLPPDRDLINDIARYVEVECDDERLIDWMTGKD